MKSEFSKVESPKPENVDEKFSKKYLELEQFDELPSVVLAAIAKIRINQEMKLISEEQANHLVEVLIEESLTGKYHNCPDSVSEELYHFALEDITALESLHSMAKALIEFNAFGPDDYPVRGGMDEDQISRLWQIILAAQKVVDRLSYGISPLRPKS